MSRIIKMKRTPYGTFVATNYQNKIRSEGLYRDYMPRLCAGATSRLFKLGREAQTVKAVFTKREPKIKGKFYKIICHPGALRAAGEKDVCDWEEIDLEKFHGGFMTGTKQAICDMYNEGYRYVRVERVS